MAWLRILPHCQTVKLKCLCSELYPPVDDRKEEINTLPCLRLAILGNICKINGLFYFVSSSVPHLWSIKEPGIQTPRRWVFWDFIVPSFKSASSPNKGVLLASTPCLSGSLACCAARSESLDLVTTSKKSNQKIGRHLNTHFFKEDIQMIKKHMKRCSTSLIIQWGITSYESEWPSSNHE